MFPTHNPDMLAVFYPVFIAMLFTEPSLLTQLHYMKEAIGFILFLKWQKVMLSSRVAMQLIWSFSTSNPNALCAQSIDLSSH